MTAREGIILSEEALQELNSRATSEIAVRQALSELDAWEVTARFTLSEHQPSAGGNFSVVKDFAEVNGILFSPFCEAVA